MSAAKSQKHRLPTGNGSTSRSAGSSSPLGASGDLATKLAVVTGEVMNLAALVRRGDDAAWSGIGPDADIRVVSELVAFADLASRAAQTVDAPGSLAAAVDCARALGEEIRTTGLPVSERARGLASELLESLGVGADLLNALDGDTPP